MHQYNCRLVCCGFTLPPQANITILYGVTFPTIENELSSIRSNGDTSPLIVNSKIDAADSKINMKRKFDTTLESDNADAIGSSSSIIISSEDTSIINHAALNQVRIKDVSKLYWPLYGGKSGPRTVFTFLYEF